uniref:Uncharacterized protein n=1 Tax=Anguilla anguilla TaxID=7936 RepID=A0A0E9VNF0_ANGAN
MLSFCKDGILYGLPERG